MRQMILAGLLATASSPMLAQPAPVAPAPQPMARAMAATTVTRAEVQTRAQTRFARRDANRDGFLTSDELAMRGGGKMRRAMRQNGGANGQPGEQAMRDPNVAFDRMDANRDGSISRDEFARGRQVRVERIVINRSGEQGGMGAMRGMNGMRQNGRGVGAGMRGAMLQRTDTNRDGKVSLAEATAVALQHFDMLDTNRDGRLTPEERQSGRLRMRQMRQAG
jgi:EF-hand domain pair/EF hand